MTFKTLSIEDLKKDYLERHGFVFAGNVPSNKDGCDKISDALVRKAISNVPVEFVVELNPSTFVFVYPVDCNFDSPYFYSLASHYSAMLGFFKVDTLAAFLRQN